MIEWAESYEASRQQMRTATVAHKCTECYRLIEPGEKYEVTDGLMDGHWDHWKTCLHCLAARDWLIQECSGYVYASVLEDLLEHWQGELMRELALGRRIVGMRRKWHRRDGALMAVLP